MEVVLGEEVEAVDAVEVGAEAETVEEVGAAEAGAGVGVVVGEEAEVE